MRVRDVMKCSFAYWYPIFRDITIESDIINLDPEIKDYLLSDGVILPKSCLLEMDPEFTDDEVEQPLPEFPQLEQNIKQAIQKYGYVFPKLNWSACDDAKWIQCNGDKCANLSEVFLLLKSSDKIVHDLTDPFKYCDDLSERSQPPVDYTLVLRKWQNLNPSMEFRVFVGKNMVLGISQRDVRSYYSHIHRQKDQIIEDILNFYESKICDKFQVECFVMDVYRPASGEITLLDINPFGEVTDSLLFCWDELRSKVNAPPPPVFQDFRYIEQQLGVQPQRLEMNSLPLDVYNGNMDPAVFQNGLGLNGHSAI